MFKAVFLLFPLSLLSACGVSAASSPTYDIYAQFEVERAKLAQLEKVRAADVLRAEQAEARAKLSECREKVSALRGTVSDRLISCKEQLTRVSECNAQKAKMGAGGTLLGCSLGMFFPPFGLLACFGGGAMGALAGGPCDEANCQTDPAIVMREVLVEQHLDALPECAQSADALPTQTASLD